MSDTEFITHRGRRILRADYTGLTTEEFVAAFNKDMGLLTQSQPASFLLLTIPPEHLNEQMANASSGSMPEPKRSMPPPRRSSERLHFTGFCS